MFKFDPKKLNTKKKLEYSRQDNIYPYQKTPDDTRWAVKCLHPKDFTEFQHVLQEIISTSNLDHPSILPINGYFTKEDEIEGWRVFIKTPRMEKSMEGLIKEQLKLDKGILPKDKVVKYLYSMASALEYLESKKIAHKAIRPANILLDTQGNIKLSGIGGDRQDLEGIARENEAYMAPEIYTEELSLKKKDFYKADVWSLGIVITEICLLKPRIVTGSLSVQEKEDIVKANMKEMIKNYGDDLVQLIENDMLRVDPGQRKSFSEICHALEDRFFNTGVSLSTRDVRYGSEEEKQSKDGSEGASTMTTLNGSMRRRRGVLKINEARRQNRSISEKIPAAKPVEGIKTVAEEMQKKWKGLFEFSLDEFLKITAYPSNTSETSEVSNEKLVEMISDLNNSLTEFKVNNVKKLTLSLISCEKVTDSGLSQLVTSLGNDLKSLEEFNLSFSKCKMVTYSGLIQFAREVKQNLKELKQLTLDFKDCENVTDTAKDGIKLLLDSIPKLTIL